MMKNIITTILCLSTIYSATAADIYVNNSGQSGTWSTITLALAAAAPGDRIFVSPYGDYTENLTIFQDVTLASAVAGTNFSVVGTLTVQGAPNMDVRIIGGEFSGSITCTTGGTGLNSKADVYITESNFSSLTAQDFIRMHLLFCNLGGASVSIKHGEVRGNTDLGYLSIPDGPNAGVGDTLFIVGNTLRENSYLNWTNDDNYFYIANNRIYSASTSYCFYMTKHHFSSVVNNNLINNYFRNSSAGSSYATPVRSTSTGNISNVYLYNNILENGSNSSSSYARCFFANGGSGSMQLYYNYCKGWSNGNTTGGTKVVGNFSLNYNAAELTVDADGRCNDATYCVDKGSTALQYYDIDMTRNDIGTYGGPYSIDNYLEVGTGNARVYDLNMPFEIWSGQTPQVKAEATHTK
jgi:hypothetical protein